MNEIPLVSNIPVKEELYLISLVMANLSGVSIVDFVERAITREALSTLETHGNSSGDRADIG